MIPRLNMSFPLRRQWRYWFGKQYEPVEGEYLLNHARTGIVMALRAALPNGGRVGVVTYNCHTVANAVVNAGCTPVFVDVTENLTIDIKSVPADLDAIVVTNLFGIRNEIAAIRKRCPKAVVIVDNAHGYGFPAEGDFTVYSINQGKFPALGEGGILKISLQSEIINHKLQIDSMYESLQKYSLLEQLKLFCSMFLKAIAYSRCVYWLTMTMKKSSNPNVHERVVMKQMAPGVRRLYKAWLPNAEKEIAAQRRNAEALNLKLEVINHKCTIGANAFMAIVRCENPAALQVQFARLGIETATHFARAIEWAKEFGYQQSSSPMAERLTKELLMIPTYKIK